MSGGTSNNSDHRGRRPLPRGGASNRPASGAFDRRKLQSPTKAPRLPGPRKPGTPPAKPASTRTPPQARTKQPGAGSNGGSSTQLKRPVPQPPRKPTQPARPEQLADAAVDCAIADDNGMDTAGFDRKLLPYLQKFHGTPDTEQGRVEGARALLNISHALYVAVSTGRFIDRPLMCRARATELAAELAERAGGVFQGRHEFRLENIRVANLLVGLALHSVRVLETTQLNESELTGFTDNYERAVLAAFGLKTQAETNGRAPWRSRAQNPLEQRIGVAINFISDAFGDLVSRGDGVKNPAHRQSVLTEFDAFMGRFAPYLEGAGRGDTGRVRRRTSTPKADPRARKASEAEVLAITEIKKRPAGVEIRLQDGRRMFISSADAREIGKSADTGRMERKDVK